MAGVAPQPAAVLLRQRLCGAVSAPVRLSITGQADGLSGIVRTAGRNGLHTADHAPSQDRPADRGRASGRRAGAVCRGAAGLPRHLRQLHAHQSGEHGRKCHHQFRLADPVQHRQEHRSRPSAAGAADRDDPLPHAAEDKSTEGTAWLEAGAGHAGYPADAAAGYDGHYVRRAGQIILRLQNLHQREHLHRQQL